MSKGRVVNELSLLTDVYVDLERLHNCIDQLRDELVEKPDLYSTALHEARQHCRRIYNELHGIRSLLNAPRRKPKSNPPSPPPRKPPNFKLVS